MASKRMYKDMAMDIKNIAESSPYENGKFDKLVVAIMEIFKADNRAFDEDKFIEAIGFDPR
jgi:hypothetical protein